MVLEACTAGALILFFWVEATILKYALGQQILLYFFSILGLVVAGFALYAHVVISLASRILVDMVSQGDSVGVNQPRFGPVESLERSEDFEGALHEYLVLARIYPRNFEVLTRTGRVNEILGRPEEAVAWYMRARKRAADAREALTAVNRMCAIFDGELDRPDDSDDQLAWFLATYPDSLDFTIVRDRLERRAIKANGSVSAQLTALDANPLEDGAERPPHTRARKPVATPSQPNLMPLAEEGATESGAALTGTLTAEMPTRATRTPRRLSLDSLERVAVSGEKTSKKPSSRSNGIPPAEKALPVKGPTRAPKSEQPKPVTPSLLQALDDVTAVENAPREAPKPAPKPKIALEAMDDDRAAP